jgi:hypothetical protein
MQARNNARIMITGSLDMFSNRYAIIWWFSISLAIICFIFVEISLCDSDFSDQAYRKLGVQESKWSSYQTFFLVYIYFGLLRFYKTFCFTTFNKESLLHKWYVISLCLGIVQTTENRKTNGHWLNAFWRVQGNHLPLHHQDFS